MTLLSIAGATTVISATSAVFSSIVDTIVSFDFHNLLEYLKSFFSSKYEPITKSPEEMKKYADAISDDIYKTALKELQEINKDYANAAAKVAREHLTDVFSKIKEYSQDNKTKLTQAEISAAELRAHEFIKFCKITNTDIAPSSAVAPDSESAQPKTEAALMPLLENLIMRGNFSHNENLHALYSELKEAEKIPLIQSITTTPSSSILCLAIALGFSTAECQRLSQRISWFNMMKPEFNFNTKYGASLNIGFHPEHGIFQKISNIGFDAKSWFEQIETEIALKVKRHWDRLSQTHAYQKLPAEEKDRLTKIANACTSTFRTDNMVTFNDLAILKKLDPKTFSELKVPVFDIIKNQEVIASKDNYPHVPIAVVIHASLCAGSYFSPKNYRHMNETYRFHSSADYSFPWVQGLFKKKEYSLKFEVAEDSNPSVSFNETVKKYFSNFISEVENSSNKLCSYANQSLVDNSESKEENIPDVYSLEFFQESMTASNELLQNTKFFLFDTVLPEIRKDHTVKCFEDLINTTATLTKRMSSYLFLNNVKNSSPADDSKPNHNFQNTGILTV